MPLGLSGFSPSLLQVFLQRLVSRSRMPRSFGILDLGRYPKPRGANRLVRIRKRQLPTLVTSPGGSIRP